MAFAATPNPLPSEAQENELAASAGGSSNAGPQPVRTAQTRQIQQQYQRAQIETATPTQLVVLLYDGAIRFCTMARKAMLVRNIDVQNTNLLKAQRIVTELMSSLDRKNGGQVADNLFGLYAYMLEQLVLANMNDKINLLDDVVNMLRELRETWQEVDRITHQGAETEAHTVAENVPPPPSHPASTQDGTAEARDAGSAANRRLRAKLASPAPPAASRLGDRDA